MRVMTGIDEWFYGSMYLVLIYRILRAFFFRVLGNSITLSAFAPSLAASAVLSRALTPADTSRKGSVCRCA
jgi:hypothetical protein